MVIGRESRRGRRFIFRPAQRQRMIDRAANIRIARRRDAAGIYLFDQIGGFWFRLYVKLFPQQADESPRLHERFVASDMARRYFQAEPLPVFAKRIQRNKSRCGLQALRASPARLANSDKIMPAAVSNCARSDVTQSQNSSPSIA